MGKKKESNEGAGVGFALLLLIALIVKFIWWILGGLALVAAFFIVRAIVRADRRYRERCAQYRAAVCARADQQHNWVMQGDDRGVYGTEGARLMRQIRS